MQQPVRIRCVGDSLTEGWIDRCGTEMVPYADFLRNALALEHSIENECSVHAVGGAVSYQVKGYLQDAIAGQAHPADYYVVLSGTNDMCGGSARILDLLDNTLRMVQAALSTSATARVILLTVPPVGNVPTAYERLRRITRVRTVYNGLLRAIASGVDGDRVLVVDTFSLVGERLPPPATTAATKKRNASDSDDEELEDYLGAIDHLLCKQKHVAFNTEKLPPPEALQQIATDVLDADSEVWALKDEYNGDGLHLNKAGYERWGRELARVIAAAASAAPIK